MRFLIPIAAMLLPAITLAAAGNPVNHKHGDRYHKHPLPKEGTNHVHGGSKPKVNPILKTPKGWTLVAKTNTGIVTLKNGSYRSEKTVSGETIGSVIFINKYKKGTPTSFTYKAYVKKTDCIRGYGTLVNVNLNGTYDSEINYADGSGTVGSRQAEVICHTFKSQRDKSIR